MQILDDVDAFDLDVYEIEEAIYQEWRRRKYAGAAEFVRANRFAYARYAVKRARRMLARLTERAAWRVRRHVWPGPKFAVMGWLRRFHRWRHPEECPFFRQAESSRRLMETAREARAALVASRHTKAASN